jgi:hypothetical protein
MTGADHPLGSQAEDDGRHPVLMSCGKRKGELCFSGRTVIFRNTSWWGWSKN